jgi:hypothetical protein
MAQKDPKALLDMVSAPIGDLIAEMGRGVASAQKELDKQALDNYKEIYEDNTEALMSLKQMGYRPTWYHIPDAEAELKVSLTLGGDYSGSRSSKMTLFASPVDAGFRNSYNYSLEASSSLKFRIVPIPEPAALEQRNIVPAVAGMTLARARNLLSSLGIAYAISPGDSEDHELVTSISPEAGTILEVDQEVAISIGA